MTAGEMEVLGHRIVAAMAQRLAAQDAPQRQHAAAQRAEARHRDARVVRAARVEAATLPQQRAEQPLVQCQQGKNEASHADI